MNSFEIFAGCMRIPVKWIEEQSERPLITLFFGYELNFYSSFQSFPRNGRVSLSLKGFFGISTAKSARFANCNCWALAFSTVAENLFSSGSFSRIFFLPPNSSLGSSVRLTILICISFPESINQLCDCARDRFVVAEFAKRSEKLARIAPSWREITFRGRN